MLAPFYLDCCSLYQCFSRRTDRIGTFLWISFSNNFICRLDQMLSRHLKRQRAQMNHRVTKYEADCFNKNVNWSVLCATLKPNWLSVVPRKWRCWLIRSFQIALTPLWLLPQVCNLMCQTYSHPCFCMCELLLCLTGIGYIPVNNAHVKQFTEKKMQRFICIEQMHCRNTIRPWSLVQGQLLMKWCQWNKRTYAHFKTQIFFLAVYVPQTLQTHWLSFQSLIFP